MQHHLDPELDEFAHEINRPEAGIDLARAALVMGKFEYPGLDVTGYLSRFDKLADAAGRAVQSTDLPALTLAQFLFDELGFSGNAGDYADPRNSFMNEVLERRLGIPISLSVLYIEIARRVDIQAQGVGLPGHFIVRVTLNSGEVVYLDPFHGGQLLSEEDCRTRVAAITGGTLPFHESFLNPVQSRYILTRMLNNLKNFYASANDFQRAAKVIERLLVMNPDDVTEMRNLGVLYGQLGKRRQAVDLLEYYLNAWPNAQDTEVIRNYIKALSDQASKWN
jgi:regulator of sirC expression with transglutaminase-like and TPR domain